MSGEMKGDPHRAAGLVIAGFEGADSMASIETAWIDQAWRERLRTVLVDVVTDRVAQGRPATDDNLALEGIERTYKDILGQVTADLFALLGCLLGALMIERGSDDPIAVLRSVLPPASD